MPVLQESALSQEMFSLVYPKVEVIKKAYMQGEVEFEDGENGEDGAASPRNVGHNIYILAHQVQPSLFLSCLLHITSIAKLEAP